MDTAHKIHQQQKSTSKNKPIGLSIKTNSEYRQQFIDEALKNDYKITSICKKYGISRYTFYKWKKRFERDKNDPKIAFSSRFVKGKDHWQHTPEYKVQKLLELVISHPEYSVHRLQNEISIIGHHGIQNILERRGLSNYRDRLAYSLTHKEAQHILPVAKGSYVPIFNTALRIPSQTLSYFLTTFFITSFFAFYWISVLSKADNFSQLVGFLFASLSLTVGMLFLFYSLKYYITVALVLSFSRQSLEEEQSNGSEIESNKKISLFDRIFGREGNLISSKKGYQGGLQPDVSGVKLSSHPFISIHLATFNEKRVIDRLLTAVTSMDYPHYEVILVDDSNDPEAITKVKSWKNHPRLTIIQRKERTGFKGGALQEALRASSPKAEFVLVFDSDFIPYPDTITQFLKYFKAVGGWSDGSSTPTVPRPAVAAIQGYQWHVLNKSENWITRGVRSEYSGSYVVERSGAEIYSGLKQISGSIYMIKRKVLDQIGWGTSITEDFELTLRLYAAGYKVVYTPYIQAPSECVSTVKRLIRQRMRWAEGHSHNVKRMFVKLLTSSKLTGSEKFEFLYLSPYYLQSAFFVFGTLSWFMAEVIFKVRLPFWTSVWGWSLVLTNMFSLPLMNMVGMFLEESEEKDYLGLLSFTVLSYLLAPFQGYAAIKGFLEKEEGPWFRTPKTGRITDVFERGRFYRWLSGIIPRKPAIQPLQARTALPGVAYSYLTLTTANNQFNSFRIQAKRMRWVAKTALSILLIISITLFSLSNNVQQIYATQMAGPMKLSLGPANAVGEGWPTQANFLQNTTTMAGSGQNLFIFHNTCCNPLSANYYWYTNLLPVGGGSFIIPTGAYNLNIARTLNLPRNNKINFAIQLILNNADGTGQNVILSNATYYINNSSGTMQGNLVTVNTMYALRIGSIASNITYSTPQQRLGLRLYVVSGTHTSRSNITLIMNNASLPAVLAIPSNIEVPEFTKVVFIVLVAVIPAIPSLISSRREKKRKGNRPGFGSWIADFNNLVDSITGRKEKDFDSYPV